MILVFLLAFFNWFMTLLGASLVFLFKKRSQKLICITLGLASGIMIAAAFFSLLLPALNQVEGNYYKMCFIPLCFFIGGLFLSFCDRFISNNHDSNIAKNKLLLLAMTLHNIPEGLVVGIAVSGNINNLLPAFILSIGIGIQNFPEGTAIALPLHEGGMSRFKAMMYGQGSALVEIPSALLGFLFAQMFNSLLPFALSFASGAMIFVCIDELIPEANNFKEISVGTMSFMIGFMIMMFLDIMLS